MFDQLRKTSADKIGGVMRVLLGAVFFMAGVLKIVVPSLGQAFSGQLVAANIPLQGVVLFAFPIVEMILGVLLVVGLHARISAAAAAVSMVWSRSCESEHGGARDMPLRPLDAFGPSAGWRKTR